MAHKYKKEDKKDDHLTCVRCGMKKIPPDKSTALILYKPRKRDYFFNREYVKQYEWVRNYLDSYGRMPVIKQNHGSWEEERFVTLEA